MTVCPWFTCRKRSGVEKGMSCNCIVVEDPSCYLWVKASRKCHNRLYKTRVDQPRPVYCPRWPTDRILTPRYSVTSFIVTVVFS